MHSILLAKKTLGCCFQKIHLKFIARTKPSTPNLLTATLTDLSRSKSQLLVENALLRQQLIVLKRQVKRPNFNPHDKFLLVILASLTRTWRQTLLILQP
jgi:putative transposase